MEWVSVDVAANKHCYALNWSYGVICVGCGCCSTNALKRAKARLAYHKKELEDNNAFSGWFEDDAELMTLQKRNVAVNIEYHSKKIRQYTKEIERLEMDYCDRFLEATEGEE